MYDAYDFSFSYFDQNGTLGANTTVCFTQIAGYLCPSDGADGRVDPPWGSPGYVGNWGGPGEIRTFSGTILSPDWGDRAYAPDARVIGLEAITDGTSNTALFGERLIGLNSWRAVTPGKSDFSKRGVFHTDVRVTINNPIAGTPTTLALLAACQALPPTTTGLANYNGKLRTIGFPWSYVVNRYNHVGPPDSMMCFATNSFAGPEGSARDSIPPTSNHSGGVNMGMADGSVKFVKDSIALPTWWALGTRATGEVISSDAY